MSKHSDSIRLRCGIPDGFVIPRELDEDYQDERCFEWGVGVIGSAIDKLHRDGNRNDRQIMRALKFILKDFAKKPEDRLFGDN